MVPGKRLDSVVKPDEMITIMYNHGGIVKNVANHLGVSLNCIYDYMTDHPEIKEAQKEADRRLDRHVVETAYEGLDAMLDNMDQDPATAFKALQLILKGSKESRYYSERTEAEQAEAGNPALLAELSKRLAALDVDVVRVPQPTLADKS